MSLTQRSFNWDFANFSGINKSVDVLMPKANGPYGAIFTSMARGKTRPINATIIPPAGSSFDLVGRKYKPEIDVTLEVWKIWDLAGVSAGTAVFQVTYDSSFSGVGISVITLTGIEQGDGFVSAPAWAYTTTDARLTHKPPHKPEPCRTPQDAPNIAQYVAHARLGSQNLQVFNAVSDFSANLFLGEISFEVFHSGTTDQSGLAVAPNYIETFTSSTASLVVSFNVYGPQVFDSKEGIPPEDEFTPEEEMRLKERITELEREVTTLREQQAIDQDDFVTSTRNLTAERDSHKAQAETSRAAVEQAVAETARILKQNTALQQQIDTIPQLLAERDTAISQLNDALTASVEQIAALQQELDATRSELQQTLAALPAHIQQAADQVSQQRISQLLADPVALRELLMQRAQASTDPRNLFAALQGMQQLG